MENVPNRMGNYQKKEDRHRGSYCYIMALDRKEVGADVDVDVDADACSIEEVLAFPK